MLRPLLISVQRDAVPARLAPERTKTAASPPHCACVFCGASLELHADDGRSCAICTLVRHLERPRIDEEARLVWLPEMSQAALVCLLREMHCRSATPAKAAAARRSGRRQPEERTALHYARTALAGRAAVAAEHLGTEPAERTRAVYSPACHGRRTTAAIACSAACACCRSAVLRRRGGCVSRHRRFLAERRRLPRSRRSRNIPDAADALLSRLGARQPVAGAQAAADRLLRHRDRA